MCGVRCVCGVCEVCCEVCQMRAWCVRYVVGGVCKVCCGWWCAMEVAVCCVLPSPHDATVLPSPHDATQLY